MKEDVWKMDGTLAEDSYTFQAAMVLLASELVGPYVDRILGIRKQRSQTGRLEANRV